MTARAARQSTTRPTAWSGSLSRRLADEGWEPRSSHRSTPQRRLGLRVGGGWSGLRCWGLGLRGETTWPLARGAVVGDRRWRRGGGRCPQRSAPVLECADLDSEFVEARDERGEQRGDLRHVREVRNRWGNLFLVLIGDATPSEARVHRPAAARRPPRATLAARALPRECTRDPRDPIAHQSASGRPDAETQSAPAPTGALGSRRSGSQPPMAPALAFRVGCERSRDGGEPRLRRPDAKSTR